MDIEGTAAVMSRCRRRTRPLDSAADYHIMQQSVTKCLQLPTLEPRIKPLAWNYILSALSDDTDAFLATEISQYLKLLL